MAAEPESTAGPPGPAGGGAPRDQGTAEPGPRPGPVATRWLGLVAVVLVGGLVLTVLGVEAVRRADASLNQAAFAAVARNHHLTVAGALWERERMLAAVHGLLGGIRGDLEQESFRRFVTPMVEVHPDVRAVVWAPVVPAPEAAPAGGPRAPVRYAVPGAAAPRLEGVDLTRTPACGPVLAAAGGTPVAFSSRELMPEGALARDTVWLIQGVYAGVPGEGGSGAAGAELRGYVGLVFSLPALVAEAARGLTPVSLRLARPGGEEVLQYGRPAAPRPALHQQVAAADRVWELELGPTPEWMARHAVDRVPGVLALGLTLTLGGAALLLGARRRSDRVHALVARRTAELRDSETRLRAVFEGMVDGLITIDANGAIQSVNLTAERMFGYRAREIVGRSVSVLMSAPDRARHDDYVRRYRGARRSTVIGQPRELSARRKNGEIFPVELSVAEMSIGGRRMFSGIVRDLSARKAAEAARDRLVNMVDTNPDLIAAFTPEGELLFMNRAGRRLLDLGAEAPADLLERLASASLREALEQERARGGQGDVVWTGETSLAVAGREPVPMAQQLVLHRVAEREYVSLFLRDISLEKRTEAALRRAKSTAENAASMKSEFLATVSHEIRTPLNGILGMTQLLQDTPLSARQEEYVQVLTTSSQALLDIISDILDFSKLEAGKLRLSEAPLDLEQMIHGVVRLVASRAAAKGVALRVIYPVDVPRRWIGDEGRLRQVLLNLVSNAVKFTERGRILVRVAAVDSGVRVSVEDTGIGISAEQRPRLFQAFSQAESSTTRRYGGTGLGLSISRRLLELMGGRIDYDSSPGEGSRFWFEAPLAPEQAPAAQPAPGAGRVAVLLAADAEEREGWTARLSRLGFSVHGCATAEAVEARLRAPGPAPALLVVPDGGADGGPAWDAEGLAALLCRPGVAPPEGVLVLAESASEESSWPLDAVPSLVLGRLAGPDQLAAAVREVLGGAPPRQPRARGTEAAPRPGQGTVLVAEDNPVNARVAAALLERVGVRSEVVSDGQAAVQRWEAGGVDLILMDCRMPVMDGMDATRAIRARERGGRVPVVALTANALAVDREQCFAAGMDGFIAKPFQASELTEILLQHLPGFRDPSLGGAEEAGAGGLTRQCLDVGKIAELEQLMGDEFTSLVEIYLEDAQALVDRLAATAGEAGGVEEQVRLAHTLKSSSANIGAGQLAETARRMEGRLREGVRELLPEDLRQLRTELEAVRAHLRARLAGSAG